MQQNLYHSMDHLKAELSVVLGESIGRLEQISEQPYASLFTLYNQQGTPLPLVAKTFFMSRNCSAGGL